MKDNQDERGGSKGELQGAITITATTKKMKIGELPI